MAAPISLDDLGGFLGEVLGDTRTVTDPWGLGIEATLTHTGNEGWQKFDLDRINDLPVLEKQRQATAEFTSADLDQGVPGFRAARKKTQAEKVQRLRRQLAEKTELQTPVETIRAQKPGIVDHLLLAMTVRGSSSVTRGGQTFDLTQPTGRLAFLSHAAWKTDGGQLAIPPFETGPDGQPVLDSEGQPTPNRFGGENVGDAIAMWLLEEAGQTAEFVQKAKATAQGKSAPVSNGPIGTGSAIPSPSAEG